MPTAELVEQSFEYGDKLWKHWLVPGDVIVMGVPRGSGDSLLVIAIRPDDGSDQVLVFSSKSRRLMSYADFAIDSMLQQRRCSIQRSLFVRA